MSSALEQLLLRISKGTIVEGLAHDVVRHQHFENIPKLLKKDNIFVKLLLIIVLSAVLYALVYIIPVIIHEQFKLIAEKEKSKYIAIMITEVFVFIVYVMIFGSTIVAMLIITLLLLLSLL